MAWYVYTHLLMANTTIRIELMNTFDKRGRATGGEFILVDRTMGRSALIVRGLRTREDAQRMLDAIVAARPSHVNGRKLWGVWA